MSLIWTGLIFTFITVSLDYFKDFYWAKVESIFPKLTRKFFGIILFILTIGGILISGFSSFESQKQADNQKYFYYATMDVKGQIHVGRTSWPTEVGLEMENLIIVTDKGTDLKCEMNGIDKIINQFPLYPFGYYFKAACLQKSKDNNWMDFAKQAKRIFMITIQFPGHSIDHEYALKKLEDILSGKSETFSTF